MVLSIEVCERHNSLSLNHYLLNLFANCLFVAELQIFIALFFFVQRVSYQLLRVSQFEFVLFDVHVRAYSQRFHVNMDMLEFQKSHVLQQPVKLSCTRSELQSHGHVNRVVCLLQTFENF